MTTPADAPTPTWVRVGLCPPDGATGPVPPGTGYEPAVLVGLPAADLDVLATILNWTGGGEADVLTVEEDVVPDPDDGVPMVQLTYTLDGYPTADGQGLSWAVRLGVGELLGGARGWGLTDEIATTLAPGVKVVLLPDTVAVPASGLLGEAELSQRVEVMWLSPSRVRDAAQRALSPLAWSLLCEEMPYDDDSDSDSDDDIDGDDGEEDYDVDDGIDDDLLESVAASAGRLTGRISGHEQTLEDAPVGWTTFGQHEPLGVSPDPDGGSRGVLLDLIDAGHLPDQVRPTAWMAEVAAMQQLDAVAQGWQRWAPPNPWPSEFTVADIPHIRSLCHFPGMMMMRDALHMGEGEGPVLEALFAPVAMSHLALSAPTYFLPADALPTRTPAGAADEDREPQVWPEQSVTVFFDRDLELDPDRLVWSPVMLSGAMLQVDVGEELNRLGVRLPARAFSPAQTRINMGMADLLTGVTLLAGPDTVPGHVIWHIATRTDASEVGPEQAAGRGYRGLTHGLYGASLLAPVLDEVAARVVAAHGSPAQAAVSYDTPEHHLASREWQDHVPRSWRVGRGRTAALPVTLL